MTTVVILSSPKKPFFQCILVGLFSLCYSLAQQWVGITLQSTQNVRVGARSCHIHHSVLLVMLVNRAMTINGHAMWIKVTLGRIVINRGLKSAKQCQSGANRISTPFDTRINTSFISFVVAR